MSLPHSLLAVSKKGRHLPSHRIFFSSNKTPRRRFYHSAIYYFRALLPLTSTSTTHAISYPRSFVESPVRNNNFSVHASSIGTRSRFSTTTSNGGIDEPQQVLSALQNLASRLEEWEPILSPPATSSLTEPDLSMMPSMETLVPEDDDAPVLSIQEYSKLFCTGFVRLPPLKLGWIATVLASPEENVIETLKRTKWECPRSAVLLYLAQNCGISLSPALSSFLDHVRNPDNDESMELPVLQQLRQMWTPKYEDIFQCLLEHNSQQTLVMLVELRGDLLRFMKVLPKTPNKETKIVKKSVQQLERHLRRLLSTWFSPGMLEVRRVTYDSTSAGIIEKIAVKEAVHPMQGLEDLRRRLGPQRRVFALFHPLLPNEPLVILHVHLETNHSDHDSHIPATMAHVFQEYRNLDPTAELSSPPRVATFYSISNTQGGLTRGLGLGEFVIKQAVRQLQDEFNSGSLETFVTLSPMPGFRKWVEDLVLLDGNEDHQHWAQRVSHLGVDMEKIAGARALLEELLISTSNTTSVDTTSIEQQLEKVQPALMHLAAHYLVVSKSPRSGKPLDPVTGFHVHNGAEVFRVNYAADLSPQGLSRSMGVMVNYQYRLDQVASNQAMFESSHYQDIPMTDSVRKLL